MKDGEKVYVQNKDFVSRQIDDEMILMPTYKTNKETNEMFTLNESASKIWELIDGKRNAQAILEEMVGVYGEGENKIAKDLEEAINDMKSINAIQEAK